MTPLPFISLLVTVSHFVRPFRLRKFFVFFLSVLRAVGPAARGFPAFLVVPFQLLLSLKSISGTLTGIVFLKILILSLTISKIKAEAEVDLSISLLDKVTDLDLSHGGQLGQDNHKFKAILCYKANSRPMGYRRPSLTTKQNKQQRPGHTWLTSKIPVPRRLR